MLTGLTFPDKSAFGEPRHDRGNARFVGGALSHCLTCAESVGFVDGPCAWIGCELRGEVFHGRLDTLGEQRDHG